MKKKTPKPLRRFLSLLLAAAISVTAQAMPVTAETAEIAEITEIPETTETEEIVKTAEVEEIAEATEEISGILETAETTEITETAETAEISETTETEETAETNTMQPLSIAGGSPANPVHHCTKQDDGSDTTDWSYVYFGSYPQTEVTGDALTPAITGAPYDGNGDAWVDGVKYRRISKSDTNNSSYFGNAQYRYFKWERIKWRVLRNDGSTLFLAADKGLDCKDYNETYASITWENCTLRSWLNKEFYGTAFSSSEQAAIVAQDVVNEDNPDYNTEGGNDTRDKVYLLSIGEVTNPEYGFCEDYSTYSASRRVQASDYAHARGASTDSGSYEGNSWWWLRSPGCNACSAADVFRSGYVNRDGSYVNNNSRVCVPALHLNLSSNLWSMADDGTSGEGGNGGTPGESVSSFTMDAAASGTAGTSLTIPGKLSLFSSAEASAELLQAEIKKITWASSDFGIIDPSAIQCSGINSMDYRSASLLITVVPQKEGIVTLTGQASNGQTAVCKVTVGKSGAAGDSEGTELRHRTGTLQSVDLNTMKVTIDSQEYEVTESFNISGAYQILNGSGSKQVAVILANGRISRMDPIAELVEPQVSVAFRPASLRYQGGSFDKDKVTAAVTLSCGAKEPYWDSDLKGTEAESQSVTFTGFTITAEDSLEFRPSPFSSSKEYASSRSATLQFGQEQTVGQDMYLEKGYAPKNVKEALRVHVTAAAEGKTAETDAALFVANIDKQAELAEGKSSNELVTDAGNLIDKLGFALSDYPMGQAGYSKAQKDAVNAAVKTWIADILATQVLTEEAGDNSIWAEFCKEAGFSNAQRKDFLTKIASKAFQKVGIDISGITGSGSLIQWKNMSASTNIHLYQKDGKAYDTITVNLAFGSLAFTGSKACTGMGSIDYSIHTASGKVYDDLNVGEVTFADFQKFAAGVEKICQNEVKKIYNLDIAPNLDKGAGWIRKQVNGYTSSRIVEALTSDTASKILKKQYGSVSGNVYKIYTDMLAKSTKGSVHCPVDVYIYDSQGKLCGSIVNNQVDTDTGEVFLYCIGEEKFFELAGDDYSIKFVGSGEGTMAYTIEEYLGTELLRTINYENVPLSSQKQYTAVIPQTQLLDTEVYHLVSVEDAQMVLPVSDVRADLPDASVCQHIWNAGKETKKPTCTSKGTKSYTCTACGTTKTEETNPTGHQHTEMRNQKASTCSEAGYTGDKYCKDCKKVVETGKALGKSAHQYQTVTTKATCTKDGSIIKKCIICSNIASATTINKIKSVTLKKAKYVYNKKAKKPAVAVKDSKGKQIASKYYTITYKNNKKVGRAAVTIWLKGKYKGTITKTFQIVPKATKIANIAPTAKGFKVTWKKQKSSTTGYQIQYSTSKKFTKKTTKVRAVKKASATKLTIRKLKAKKKYYVRIRTYKTVKGKKYCSSWSKPRTVTTGR